MKQPTSPNNDGQGNETQVGVRNAPHCGGRCRPSIHFTAIAASCSILSMYAASRILWGLSEIFDVDVFSNTLLTVQFFLGGIGCLCLILCFISKFCRRRDVSLALSFAGTLLSAGFLGITFYTWLEVGLPIEDLFIHGHWPFYASVGAVLFGLIATLLNFFDFQKRNQDQVQPM